ncbi:MAG TPA: alpha/beta hydrolase [Synechococcales cyanobacterium M55_K2018_004]|nr:alpha/beta hydrolase [Synechococcales cyanobacterium M55_K2018_004]
MRVPLLAVQKFLFTAATSSNPSETPQWDVHVEVTTADIRAPEPFPATIPGYFVESTAPINTEDQEVPDNAFIDPNQQSRLTNPIDVEASFRQAVRQIADHLTRPQADDTSPELVVLIHGYNTGRASAETWYKSVFQYVNRTDPAIQQNKNAVFVGYRWPSENINLSWGGLGDALKAMPIVPRIMLRVEFVVGIVAAIALLLAEGFLFGWSGWSRVLIDLLLLVLLGMACLLGAVFLSLVLLRMSAYFRDSYRATHYGVPDLVELLRALDNAIGDRSLDEKVKLTLIGHSMGGFVVTNTVRILSDVFDSRSIEKHPDACIGHAFRLERLILASPDIPVLTIASGRANFLASSLRRFSEAYLFSNQGDIVLRIASTAANYFSFPAKTRSSGYRLGNVAIRSDRYGIVNLDSLQSTYAPELAGKTSARPETALQQIFVSNLPIDDPMTKTDATPGIASRSKLPRSIAEISRQRFRTDIDRMSLADLFTYFDCTDYKDVGDRNPTQETGLLTRARRKMILGFWDYFQLTRDYGKPPNKGRIDVHGGYFEGQFSKEVIYRLAFLGFDGLQQSLRSPEDCLAKFDTRCREKGIKVLLSPLRYWVNVQKQDLAKARLRMLNEIEAN